MKRFFILLAALAVSACIPAKNANLNTNTAPLPGTNSTSLVNPAALAVEGQDLEYHPKAKGYLARPTAPGMYPGVVMIHEWWGLNDNIKEMARTLAGEGYTVLAADLYQGQVGTTREEAQALRTTLTPEQAVANLRAAAAYLRTSGATKVASLGWCFGGGKSLELALSGEPLDATVIYYGSLVTEEDKLDAIDWPVLGIFGDQDTSIPVETVDAFKQTLTQLQVANEIYIYPGVGHAFANPTGQSYAPTETKDAWAKTVTFLNQNLKPAAAAQ